MTEFYHKRMLVCGLARSGQSAARLLLGAGAVVTVADRSDTPQNRAAAESLTAEGAKVLLGGNPDAVVGEFEYIVISPGIPIDTPFILKARALGVTVIGEMELGYRACRAKIAAVTGTNGKTTAVTILGDIFRRQWPGSMALGNIGEAFCQEVTKIPADAWVALEVSSFQLESVRLFRPQISAVLNISEDHLDRHYTMANYIAMKERIFANQRPEDTVVLNYDDPVCRDMAKRAPSQAAYFSAGGEPGEKNAATARCVFQSGGEVIYRYAAYYERLWSVNDMRTPFYHIVEDAMAAALIAICAGASFGAVADGVLGFSGVEHRAEFVGVVGGVAYYNDSKATNVDAALKALTAVDGRVILIGGGQDKKANFAPWVNTFYRKVKRLIVYGETAEQIIQACDRAHFAEYERAGDLREAVAAAKGIAVPGDKVLFSPACASLDMFKNYEERGRLFKEYVGGM